MAPVTIEQTTVIRPTFAAVFARFAWFFACALSHHFAAFEQRFAGASAISEALSNQGPRFSPSFVCNEIGDRLRTAATAMQHAVSAAPAFARRNDALIKANSRQNQRVGHRNFPRETVFCKTVFHAPGAAALAPHWRGFSLPNCTGTPRKPARCNNGPSVFRAVFSSSCSQISRGLRLISARVTSFR